MGMFVPVHPGDIIVLPPSVKVCSGFTSRGQLCDHNGPECSKGLHAFNAKQIANARGMGALIAIGDSFIRSEKGAFNKRQLKDVELPSRFDNVIVDADESSHA